MAREEILQVEEQKSLAEKLLEEEELRRKKRGRLALAIFFALLVCVILFFINYEGKYLVGYLFRRAIDADLEAIKTCPELTYEEVNKAKKIALELKREFLQDRVLRRHLTMLNRLHYDLNQAFLDKQLSRDEVEPLIEEAEEILFLIKTPELEF